MNRSTNNSEGGVREDHVGNRSVVLVLLPVCHNAPGAASSFTSHLAASFWGWKHQDAAVMPLHYNHSCLAVGALKVSGV